MKEPSQIDPFAQLWQSAPKLDTRQLMLDVQRLHKTHQWHNRILILILCGIALLLIFYVATERSKTLGILSALWMAYVVGAIWFQRVRCGSADALNLDTVSLLKRMIARAKRGLFQARCLYVGTPVAALVATGLTRTSGLSLTSDGHAVPSWLALMQTIAGLIALVIMVVAGLILAKARRRQLQELTEKLRSLGENL